MAKTANSIPMSNASHRRFGAGLLAAVAGGIITSGVAFGTAASVGDLVLVDIDVELIALYPEFDVLERQRQHSANTARTMEEDDAVALVWERTRRQQTPVLDRMPMPTMKPYTDDAASMTVGDLTLENGRIVSPSLAT